MAQINPNIPIIGDPVATEEPKVKAALEDIVDEINGKLDNTNIAAAGVANINGAKLLDASVAAAKLTTDSVETDKIVNDAVTNDKIGDDAVDTAQIADGAVETAQINDGAVTNAKVTLTTSTDTMVNDASVTAGTVTARKYTDGQVLLTGVVTVPWEGYFSTATVHGETFLGLLLGTLPAGYRPSAAQLLTGLAFLAGSYGTTQPTYVIIGTDGTVTVRDSNVDANNPTRWVLDGVVFHAA